MNLDLAVLHALNGTMGHSRSWDAAIDVINRDALIGGGVTMTVVWWLWFRGDGGAEVRRARLFAAVIGGVLSVALGRALALGLPMRIRPLQDLVTGTRIPLVYSGGEFHGWSSFPSDHAMVFGAIAVGVGYVSAPAGVLLLLHALLIVCVPRIMLGLHYPSDILAGAEFGALIAILLQQPRAVQWFERRVTPLQQRRPGLFHAGFFLLCYQLANMFHDVRALGSALAALRHGG